MFHLYTLIFQNCYWQPLPDEWGLPFGRPAGFWRDKSRRFTVWLNWEVFTCGLQPFTSAILTLANGPVIKYCAGLFVWAPSSCVITQQRGEGLRRAVCRCWELMNHFCNTTFSSSPRIALQHVVPKQLWLLLLFWNRAAAACFLKNPFQLPIFSHDTV